MGSVTRKDERNGLTLRSQPSLVCPEGMNNVCISGTYQNTLILRLLQYICPSDTLLVSSKISEQVCVCVHHASIVQATLGRRGDNLPRNIGSLVTSLPVMPTSSLSPEDNVSVNTLLLTFPNYEVPSVNSPQASTYKNSANKRSYHHVGHIYCTSTHRRLPIGYPFFSLALEAEGKW